jgi:hypothetical protein
MYVVFVIYVLAITSMCSYGNNRISSFAERHLFHEPKILSSFTSRTACFHDLRVSSRRILGEVPTFSKLVKANWPISRGSDGALNLNARLPRLDLTHFV